MCVRQHMQVILCEHIFFFLLDSSTLLLAVLYEKVSSVRIYFKDSKGGNSRRNPRKGTLIKCVIRPLRERERERTQEEEEDVCLHHPAPSSS